jgi:uncharacterized membrane-anchored protein YitT (DUF2179 family)
MLLQAALAGMSFSLIGVAYQLGAPRGLRPLQIMAVCSFCGLMVFGSRALAVCATAPAAVWIAGIAAGVTQYLTTKMVRQAMRLGPLSPLWCAIMLNFIPVILFGCYGLGERFSPWDLAAIFMAVACVAASSMLTAGAPAKPETGAGRGPLRQRLEYGALLLAVLVVNSCASIAFKYLAAVPSPGGGTLLAAYAPLYMTLLYGSLLPVAVADLVLSRVPVASVKTLAGVGGLAGLGSTGGLWLQSRVMTMPTSFVFTISGVTSIVFTALVATRFFGERRTRAWYAVTGTGVLTVLLAGVGQWWT